MEADASRYARQATPSCTYRRSQELRDRRRHWSEQRDLGSSQPSQRASSVVPSSSRLQALAEYDAAMAESEAKRKREAEENRLNASKNETIDTAERRRERLKTMFEDEQRKDASE